MAISVVSGQSDVADSLNGSAAPSFPVNVTTGNAIVFGIGRFSSTGTFTLSDPVNGTYTPTVSFENSGDLVNIYVQRNVVGGWNTFTLTCSDTVTFYCVEYHEITGQSNSQSITTDNNTEAASTTHLLGGTGLSGTGMFFGGACLNTGVNVFTGSGWASMSGLGNVTGFFERKIETGTNEQGPFTAASAVNTNSAMVFIPDTSGDVVSTGGVRTRLRNLMGFGS